MYMYSLPGSVKRTLKEGNHRELLVVQQEIHSIVQKENQIAFSVIMLVYIWLCWFILRKYPLEAYLRFLPAMLSTYFVVSVWNDWHDIQQSAEEVWVLLARL